MLAYIKRFNLSKNKTDELTNYVINMIRNSKQLDPIDVSDVTVDQYFSQIINMIKNHPELSNSTYKNYIKFVFEKVMKIEKSKHQS